MLMSCSTINRFITVNDLQLPFMQNLINDKERSRMVVKTVRDDKERLWTVIIRRNDPITANNGTF